MEKTQKVLIGKVSDLSEREKENIISLLIEGQND